MLILPDCHRNPVSIAVALVIGFGTIVYAVKDKGFRASFDNVLAGLTIGLLVCGAWYTTGVIGNDEFEPVPVEAVTFIAPSGNLLNYLMTWTGSQINFGIAVVLGMIFGSFLYAILTETFDSRPSRAGGYAQPSRPAC